MVECAFGQTTATLAVLPARVVYLIAAGSRSGFRRVGQEASCRWAGMTELIVPLRQRGGIAAVWVEMVEHGEYDCLVNVDASSDAAERAKRQLQLPLVQLRNIDRAGPSQYSVHPSNVLELAPRPNAPLMATSADAPLWEVASAGDLTDEHLADPWEQGFARRPRCADEIGRAQIAGETLFDRGLEQFGEHHASGGGFSVPTVLWITKPNSLTDCLWFWNCRALRPLTFNPLPIYLLPHRGTEHWVDFAGQLGSALARSEDIEPDVALCSLSVQEAELKVLAASFGLEAALCSDVPAPAASDGTLHVQARN